MAFTFGGASTSGQSSGGLFGTTSTSNTGASGGSLFGTAGGNTGFSFGQTAKSGDDASKSGGAGIFGGGSSTGGNIFGQPNQGQSTESKPLFGNLGSASSQAPGTPGQTAAPKSLFGSTTPAGQPPQGSLFGASTGTSTSQAQSSSTPTFSFGKPAESSSTAATSAAASGGIFGQPSGSTGGLFGQKSDNNQASGGGGLFGQRQDTSQAPPGGLFGLKPAEQSSSTPLAPSGGLFGKQDSSQAPASSNLFGSVKPATSQSPANIFGAQSSAPAGSAPTFNLGQQKKDDKPAEPASQSASSKPFQFPAVSATQTEQSSTPNASQPTPSSIFTSTAQPAQKPSNLFSPAATSSAPTGNLFAKPGAPASQTAQQSQPGGFQFPVLSGGTGAKTDSDASSSAATTTTSAGPSSLFGNLGGNKTDATTSSATSTATSTATAAAPLGGTFKLGGDTTSKPQATTGTSAQPQPSSTAAPAGFGASNLGQSTLGASTAGPAPPHQSRLRNKTMDEILTRWASDLTRYTKEFKQHAETIAYWDQVIVDNSSKIDKLYVKTRTCEKQTMSVEMQLTAVENQQNELEAWLNKYENDVDEMLAKDGPAANELGGPDQERERTYKLAEKLGERLDDMGRDLQSMIEEVNAANASLGKTGTADEPITQIVKILNSHLSQLQAIDQGTSALQAKVAAAQKAASGMTYLNGSLNGNSHTAVDDFYRSYMGRR